MIISSTNGEISVSSNVVKDIVSNVVTRFEYFSPVKKDKSYINVNIKENEIVVIVYLKILQGVDVVESCQKLQKDIHDTIVQMLGYENIKVNIDILGFLNN